MNANPAAAALMTDAIGTGHQRAVGEVRIVSLVPSLTELVCELGLGDKLVGRTGFCVHPRAFLKQVAKVGGTKDVRVEAVRALEPTHLLVNIDENRREVVDELATFIPHVIVTHPCAPEDNRDLYRLFGHVFGCASRAQCLETELDQALAEARAAALTLPPERVLYLIWRAPWMTISRATYLAAMLARVGWASQPADAAERYPQFGWDAAWLAQVDRVLAATEPYRFRDRHIAEIVALSGRPVSLIDGEMVSWYGSRAIAGLRYLVELRRALHAATN
ncbi:MAG: ABC transporter substrate-binding protein [Rhodocyclales bacterium]|nr:ABC transporter substrate-binding protein [Rhodocyclales bacterium]